MPKEHRALLVEEPRAGHRLGRHVDLAPENIAYPMAAALTTTSLRAKTWWRPGPFDQGNSSSCVWQTWAGILVTSPVRQMLKPKVRDVVLDPNYRQNAYVESQRNDEWPGEEPTYFGTSVRAGGDTARRRGLIREFRWGFNKLDDVLPWLANKGPVGIGVPWYESFDNIGPDGRFPSISGALRGGHAMELIGINPTHRTVTGMQSWGDWGKRGRFYMSWETLEILLSQDGEAVGVVL